MKFNPVTHTRVYIPFSILVQGYNSSFRLYSFYVVLYSRFEILPFLFCFRFELESKLLETLNLLNYT